MENWRGYKLFIIINQYILGIVDIFILFWYMGRVYGKLEIKKYMWYILFFIGIAIAFRPGYYSMIVGTTLAINILLPMYKKNFKKKVFLQFVLLALVNSWASLCREFSYQYNEYIYKLLIINFCHVGYWLMLFIIGHFYKEPREKLEMDNKMFAVMMIFPAISYLWDMLFSVYINHDMSDSQVNRLVNWIGIPTWCVLIFLAVLLFYLYAILEKHQENIKKKLILQQQLDLQIRHYNEINEVQMEVMSIKHDMKNYINTLKCCFEQNDEEGIRELLSLASDKINSTEKRVLTGNPHIDSILNLKFDLAEDKGITIKRDISIPKSLPLNYDIIVVIFGNLLDNAIEAQENIDSEKREIYFVLKYINFMLYLEISNPYDETKIKVEDGFKTTKKDNKNHGFGLYNVRKCIESLDGTMDIDTANGLFSVKVLLYSQS